MIDIKPLLNLHKIFELKYHLLKNLEALIYSFKICEHYLTLQLIKLG